MAADRLDAAAMLCGAAFSFLVTDYGFAESSRTSDVTSFTVRFQTDATGVQVSYAVRGGLIVWVCQLENGRWPSRPGRITDESAIRWFDLYDIQAIVEGQPPVIDEAIFALPDASVLQARAESLRVHADSLLRGDFALVPQLRARVMSRASGS